MQSDIKTGSDVSSFVTGIILRQTSPFRREMVIDIAKRYSRGSVYAFGTNELENMIDERLDLYKRNNDLSYKQGFYYPKTVEHYL